VTRNELARLLNLYPVDLLRATWDLNNLHKDQAVARIVKDSPEPAILDFAAKHHPCTRQHVYLFDLASPVENGFPSNPIGGNIAPVIRRVVGGRREYFFCVDLKFAIVLLNVPRHDHIEFKWPIFILAEDRVLQIKFTTMEKDLGAYFDGAPVSVRVRSVDEKSIIQSVKETLSPTWEPSPMDINKGIKALWEQDFMDSPQAQWKNAKSTTIETMDEHLMIKRERQDVYNTLVNAPLLKTQFQVRDDESPVSRFVVDAGSGIIKFPKFSMRPEGTTDVIAKILELN